MSEPCLSLLTICNNYTSLVTVSDMYSVYRPEVCLYSGVFAIDESFYSHIPMQRDSAGLTTIFISLPVELHHQILCFMDPEAILALRKTSKYFLALTHESRLWTTVYDRMRQTHPLSCSQSEFATLAPWQSERLLTRASKTEKLFQTFRGHALRPIFPDGQAREARPLSALSFLSEHFLFSVDDATVVYVWDISELGSPGEAPAFPCARLTLIGWRFLAYRMSIDHSTLYVVLAKGDRTHIFSLSLPLNTPDTDQPKLSFRDVAYFDTYYNDLKDVDVDSCLVFMQRSDIIMEVVDLQTERRSTFTLETTEAFPPNCVLAVRICGPYILCFRYWSVDAYPIPHQFLKPELATEQPLPVLQYTMPVMAFSARTSFSRVRHSRPPSGDVYTLWTLAENVRRGRMDYYQVDVHMTPVPLLNVGLIGGAHADRRISAWDLGTTGLRGAWVLTPNSSGECHVVAFTTHPLASRSPLDRPPATFFVPRLREQLVAVVSSIYSDDYVTHCAVSEFTGRIALGRRSGEIMVL